MITHSVLATLDPDGPLDDLEPLADIVGDARVVAVGEGAHFVAEFTLARARVTRFLAERCGFRVLAMEFGFGDGFGMDEWLRGAPGELADHCGLLGVGVAGEYLRWLRRYNTGSAALRFAGVDIPTSTEVHRDLEPVARLLRQVDPEALPWVTAAQEVGRRFTGGSVAVSAQRWARLPRAEQDTLTTALSRLELRMRALESLYAERSDQAAVQRVSWTLRGVRHMDHMFQALHGLFTGTGLPGDTSVRDRFMADSLRWHLERAAPHERFVLVAHNSHIQKAPVSYDGTVAALPMGFFAGRELGADYRAVAVTHTAARVPEMHYPDASSPVGFTVSMVDLPEPSPGSVERLLVDAGLADRVTLTDLRGVSGVDSMWAQSARTVLPVAEAFDAVLSTPTATQDATIPF
ncbi:erythromycin esterase family protein [Actinosynnema sp. ALI-1.44]|uniref:erythromycin esterase family protein n=1 Tax=Actinosynnema sp. ALI-1.44 TaxID=1933779 RepID=UPI001ED9F1A2|nr:erythromycin esterase family protein [Actinosynnema sp. ALI-1.44]